MGYMDYSEEWDDMPYDPETCKIVFVAATDDMMLSYCELYRLILGENYAANPMGVFLGRKNIDATENVGLCIYVYRETRVEFDYEIKTINNLIEQSLIAGQSNQFAHKFLRNPYSDIDETGEFWYAN